MVLGQLGSVFKVPGLAETHRRTSTGQSLIRHCPTLPGHRGCWHLNLLTAILLLQGMPRAVLVVTVGRHLALCSPQATPWQTWRNPSTYHLHATAPWMHGAAPMATEHKCCFITQALHSHIPALPIPHPECYITYRSAAGPPYFLTSLNTPIPPQGEKWPSDIMAGKYFINIIFTLGCVFSMFQILQMTVLRRAAPAVTQILWMLQGTGDVWFCCLAIRCLHAKSQEVNLYESCQLST